jgi:TatD DNase family protein
MLVDSHCHLDFDSFAGDLDNVVARAGEAGVGMMVTIATSIEGCGSARRVAERFPNVYCSVGVHPHEAKTDGQKSADLLVRLTGYDKTVGIGETGLDYYYEHSPRDDQQVSFRAHIQAARETGLPVIVHTRDADEDTAAILTEEMKKGPFTGLIHCFSSGPKLAEIAVELGLYISVSGIATFKAAEELRQTLSGVPMDRLLVETDAPYLAPTPNRGKRNEPAFVAYTAARLAEIKGAPVEEIAAATTDNFFRLFTRADRARLVA